MYRLLAALLLAALPVRAQPVMWTAATEYPASAMPGEGLATFASLVAAASGGRLVVQPRFDGPDGLRSATIPGAVQSGRITVGDAFAGALDRLDPVFQLSSLPFLATDAAAAQHLAQAARPFYAAAFARLGQHLLYVTPWPASGIWSRHPIVDAVGLRGLAIRTYDGASTAVFSRAGALAEPIAFADAMPRLADGSLGAVLSSGDGGAGRKLWDQLPCFTAIGYAMPLSFTTVNDDAYAALDPALRQAVDDAAIRSEASQWTRLGSRDAANRAAMAANGMQVAEASPDLSAALHAAAKDIVAAWQRTVPPEAAALASAAPGAPG